MSQTSLTRRSFVRTAAVAGAAAAMGGALTACTAQSNDSTQSDSTIATSRPNYDYYTTSCHGCITTCPVKVYVEDGVVKKIEGHPAGAENNGSVCVKALSQIHTCYSPRRVLYPMRRTGAHGAENMAFERVSWDDAIEEATDNWLEIFEKYGTYSMLSTTGGGGAYVSAPTMPSVSASCYSPNAFEPGAAQCFLPRVCVTQLMGFKMSDSIADNEVREPFKGFSKADKEAGITNDCEVLVLWATQPSSSQTAKAGRAMAELRANGCKTIVVDPMLTPDAAKADVFLQLRPGSDCALILSWYRYIFENNLYNEEFTKYWTNLPCLIDPDTLLPILATDVIDGYEQTTPEDTPVYLCIDEDTGEVAALPYGMPEDVPVNPSVFGEIEVNGKTCKTAGQYYKEEAEFWTLEKAAEFCWLDADKIEEAINLYVSPYQNGSDGGAGIGHGVATDQMECSSQAPIGTAGLDSIMGYVQKPGCALTLTGTGSGGPGGGGGSSYELDSTNAWGKCISDGLQSRATQSETTSFGIGYTMGATEETNMANYESYASPEQDCFQQIVLDRLGVSNHRGLAHWYQSHIPTVRQAVETGDPWRPRAWLDTSGNKFAMLGSAGAWYNAALENMEYIVHQYPHFTSFDAELTDMFFPTEEWLEMWNSGSSQLNIETPCGSIIHLGEAVDTSRPYTRFLTRFYEKANEKLDSIVFNGTGQTLAEIGVEFPLVSVNGGSDESTKQSRISQGAALLGLEGEDITEEQYREAWKNNPAYNISTPSDEYWTYGHYLVLADDGLPVGFPTVSRKVEVYCTAMVRLGQTGFPYNWPKGFDDPVDERIATFHGTYAPICVVQKAKETPDLGEGFEDFAMDPDPDFPLALTSGRRVFFHHGTMRHAPFNRELYPVPFAYVNPETAAEYGIEDGDWIEVSSRRTQGEEYDISNLGTELSYAGEKQQNTKTADPIHTIAYVTEMVAPKVVFMERFWNPECFDNTQETKTGGWQECNVNVLTNAVDANFNEAFGSYTNRAFAVNIKKSERPDRVWVTPEEFEPFMPTTANQASEDVGVLIDNAEMLTEVSDFDPVEVSSDAQGGGGPA